MHKYMVRVATKDGAVQVLELDMSDTKQVYDLVKQKIPDAIVIGLTCISPSCPIYDIKTKQRLE